jgi:hypothetical protein
MDRLKPVAEEGAADTTRLERSGSVNTYVTRKGTAFTMVDLSSMTDDTAMTEHRCWISRT